MPHRSHLLEIEGQPTTLTLGQKAGVAQWEKIDDLERARYCRRGRDGQRVTSIAPVELVDEGIPQQPLDSRPIQSAGLAAEPVPDPGPTCRGNPRLGQRSLRHLTLRVRDTRATEDVHVERVLPSIGKNHLRERIRQYIELSEVDAAGKMHQARPLQDLDAEAREVRNRCRWEGEAGANLDPETAPGCAGNAPLSARAGVDYILREFLHMSSSA
jgi:hypothetical protein